MTLSKSFWDLCVSFFRAKLQDEDIRDQLSAELLPHVSMLLKLKRKVKGGEQKVIALRAQYARELKNLNIFPGDVAIFDLRAGRIVLFQKSRIFGMVQKQFADIPFVENDEVLWLPLFHISDVDYAMRTCEINHEAYENLVARNFLRRLR